MANTFLFFEKKKGKDMIVGFRKINNKNKNDLFKYIKCPVFLEENTPKFVNLTS